MDGDLRDRPVGEVEKHQALSVFGGQLSQRLLHGQTGDDLARRIGTARFATRSVRGVAKNVHGNVASHGEKPSRTKGSARVLPPPDEEPGEGLLRHILRKVRIACVHVGKTHDRVAPKGDQLRYPIVVAAIRRARHRVSPPGALCTLIVGRGTKVTSHSGGGFWILPARSAERRMRAPEHSRRASPSVGALASLATTSRHGNSGYTACKR